MPYPADLSGLESSLTYKFKNPDILLEALTHASYHYERPKKAPGYNERLEFLGDAVLGLVAAEHLFGIGGVHDALSEARMSKLKSHIVKAGVLFDAASGISLGEYLRVGKGEEVSGGRAKKSLVADALEAVFGAVYLDGGLEAAREVVLRLLGRRIAEAVKSGSLADYKSRLQEDTQRSGVLPEYRVVSETGEAHKRTYKVEVYIKGKLAGSGEGATKKEAEVEAAKEALLGGLD